MRELTERGRRRARKSATAATAVDRYLSLHAKEGISMPCGSCKQASDFLSRPLPRYLALTFPSLLANLEVEFLQLQARRQRRSDHRNENTWRSSKDGRGFPSGVKIRWCRKRISTFQLLLISQTRLRSPQATTQTLIDEAMHCLVSLRWITERRESPY